MVDDRIADDFVKEDHREKNGKGRHLTLNHKLFILQEVVDKKREHKYVAKLLNKSLSAVGQVVKCQNKDPGYKYELELKEAARLNRHAEVVQIAQ